MEEIQRILKDFQWLEGISQWLERISAGQPVRSLVGFIGFG